MSRIETGEFNILNRRLSVFGSHFLEASAGTGKTFAIQHFVVRLLLESDEPLLLDQILVVTFTRSATRELKARIRSNLISARDQLQSGDIHHDYLRAVFEGGTEAVGKSIRRLEDAISCFDSSQIFTIHGFCYRALSEFAFETRVSFDLSDPDNTQYLKIVEEAVHEFLLYQLDNAFFSPGQATILLRYFKKKPEQLKTRLTALVSQNREIETYGSFSESFQAWQQALLEFKELKKEDLFIDLSLHSSLYKQMGSGQFADQMQQLARMLQAKECTPKEFDQLLKEKEFFLDKMEKGNLKIRAKMPDPSVFRYPGLVERLRAELLPILAAGRDPMQILLSLAWKCRQEMKSRLNNGDPLTPDDLLLQMHQNLHEKKFVERIRTRYRAAIIDEFQDTDPMQWEIFETLFIGHLRSICLVGDPKQSIYAFRNADLYTYLKAVGSLGKESRKYLDTNYRSTPPLVGALNRLFASERTKGWMTLPHLGISLDVLPVKAGKPTGESDESGLGAVHFFAAETERAKRGSRWPSEVVEQKAFFPYIAQEMLAKKNNAPWSQYAVLVKDRFQAQRLWEFLKNFHIPSIIRKSAPLNESDAFIALYELVDAVCFPSDLNRLKKLLGGPLIGWGHEQIKGTFDKELLQEAKDRVLLLQDLLYQSGFSPFFREFLTSAWGRDSSVEEHLLAQGNLNLYCDLQQLAEMVIESAWRKKRVSEKWLSLLDEIRSSSVEEDSRMKRRVGSDEDAVQILTIHMSKGLEFDIVFALGVASSHPLHDEIAIQSNGKSRIVSLELDNPACCRSLQEIDAEKLRQLYVALTRAKKQVYIPLLFDLKNHTVPLGKASPIELYFSAASLPSFDYVHVDAFLNEIKEEASITLSRVGLCSTLQAQEKKKITLDLPPQKLSSFPAQPIVSYSSLAKKAEPEIHFTEGVEKFQSGSKPPFFAQDPDSDQDEIPTVLNMPLGAQTGLIFHSIMEKIFQQSLHFSPKKKAIADLIEKQTAHTFLNKWKAPLFETIWELLHKPLKGFSLSEIPPVQIQGEMEFLFPFEKGLMKGFIDLIFESGKKYYLLDWKTNHLGSSLQDYSKENVLKSMSQHDYFLQATIYKEALKRYVKLFDKRPFSECFGGAFYIFVRGRVVHYVDS